MSIEVDRIQLQWRNNCPLFRFQSWFACYFDSKRHIFILFGSKDSYPELYILVESASILVWIFRMAAICLYEIYNCDPLLEQRLMGDDVEPKLLAMLIFVCFEVYVLVIFIQNRFKSKYKIIWS